MLGKYEMPYNAKSCFFEGSDKRVCMVPAVKANRKTAVAQDAIHLVKGGLHPVASGVACDAAPRAVTVIHQIRRISDNQIYAVGCNGLHERDAIPVK